MQRRRYSGRYLMLLGAVALAVWAGYEFWVRMETVLWALKGLYNLCVAEGVPFVRALNYFDRSMFELVGFLLACTLFAIAAICLRNRPRAGYALIAMDLALLWIGWGGLHLFGLSILHWMQSLKIIPLLAILVGCAMNLCQFYVTRRRRSHGRHRRWENEDFDEERPTNREMARQVRRRRYEEAG